MTVFTKQGFRYHVKDMKEYEKATIKVLALLLGFFVSTIMNRWWGQLVKLPQLADIAMILNGIITASRFVCFVFLYQR